MENTTLEEIEKEVKEFFEQITEKLKYFVGKEVIIPEGKYTGRVGVITDINVFHRDGILACCPPYRLIGDPVNDLLWNHPDARSYWKIKDGNLL